MKAVVVDIKENHAAVLADDGCISRIKNNNYELGQVVFLNQSKHQMPKKLVAFAASVAAFVVLSVGGWAYATPYSYVSIDVNPSIEYTLNRFERVLSIKAVNDDGSEIINEFNLDGLQHAKIHKALAKTVKKIAEAGYFSEAAEGNIVIATSGKNLDKAEELAEELEQEVTANVLEQGDKIEVEAISVGLERVEEARDLGVTPGKFNLVEKLQDAAMEYEAIDFEEWLDKPVKDIMKATKEYTKAASSNSEDTFQDSSEDEETDKAKDKADKAEDKAKDKADKAEDKAKDKADKAEDKAKDKADKAEDKAKDKANKAEDKAKDKIDKFEDKAKDKADKAEDKAKDKADKAEDKAKDKNNKDNSKDKVGNPSDNGKDNQDKINLKSNDNSDNTKNNNNNQNNNSNSNYN